jgi:NitT/TauT family transport system substrate-binding protein
MNKKLVMCTVLALVLMVGSLGAQGVRASEDSVDASVTIAMAVMQGPTGFGTIGLNRNDGMITEEAHVDLSVFPSPNEVIARLANGELDVAALPTNVAANLYAKGVQVKTAAIIGEGMLMFLTNDRSITELSDLAGRTIHIPGSGSTPDQMTKILTSALGFDYEQDVILDYSIASPAQLVQMLIAGKVELAVIPEPFVTMALNATDTIVPLLDMQELWSALTGTGNYPMTVVVVADAFAEAHPDLVPAVMGAIEDSVHWVTENPQDAALLIEEAGIMKAAVAAPAIPRCNLVFKTAQQGYEAMDTYLKVLHGFDYTSVGGTVPDASFYLDY